VETSAIQTDYRDVLSFGEDEEAERMLQILHSSKIKEHIVEKFNLMEHYDIDMDSRYPYTQLDNAYSGNINFRRTQFSSIEIEVLDKNPQVAADIANEIAMYIDSAFHSMQKERALEAYRIVEREYRNAQQELRQLNDSLQTIRKRGVIDYKSQAEALNEAYTEAIIEGNNQAINAIKQKMNTLTKYGGKYIELSAQLETAIERQAQLKEKFVSAKVNVEQTIPQLFIVEEAKKAEKKAEPKRSVIVFVTTLSTFAFTLLLLLVMDNIKARRKQ
jgi:uncharacterized protein involved in exopolysaccharide biosynthesis